MKISRLIAILMICAFILLTLASCTLPDGYTREQFFGVVRMSESCGRLVIYIPELGDVDIPEYNRCYSSFSGDSESADADHQLREGDLILISFKYKRSWDDRGVAVRELYPAQFDRSADSISVLRENVSLEKTDGAYLLSFCSAEDAPNFAPGDQIYIIYQGGKDGRAYLECIGEGRVYDISEDRISVELADIPAPSEFLSKFVDAEFSHEWP